MEAIVQTFFNPEIIEAAYPIVLACLLNTILLSVLSKGNSSSASRIPPLVK